MNQKALELANVDEGEFRKWCRENGKAYYKPETKKEFFARIQDGRLVRNEEGKLVKKYNKKEN